MLLIKESKTKDIDKEVRLLRKYELAVRGATIKLPCAIKAFIRASAHTFPSVFEPNSWQLHVKLTARLYATEGDDF